MPLLDSFLVDHTIMKSPAVRIAKDMKTKSGENIRVFDLRFCKPNVEILSETAIHTLEHMFAGFMRQHLNSKTIAIIDISPMGCRTGFYMSVIGKPSESEVITAWLKSMEDVMQVKSQDDIPELNKYQCGTYEMHSLEEAQEVAANIIKNNITINENQNLKLSEEQLAKINK